MNELERVQTPQFWISVAYFALAVASYRSALRLADAEGALDAADLHRLAWSAGLTRDEHMLATTEVTAIRRR